MSDQNSVFNSEQQATQPQEQNQPQEQSQESQQTTQPPQEPQQPDTQSGSVFADQLASIKNESGEPKYRDVQTALDALKHSQDYIPQLKADNERLQRELEEAKNNAKRMEELEQTIDRLTASQGTQEEAPQGAQGLTPEQIQELLDKRLAERETQAQVQKNLEQVETTLRTQYGDKAAEVVTQKANEYGMTPAELQKWAEKSPQAVLALFNAKPSTSGGKTKPSSSVNIPPTTPSNEVEVPKLDRFASTKEKTDHMAAIKKRVYQRLGVDE